MQGLVFLEVERCIWGHGLWREIHVCLKEGREVLVYYAATFDFVLGLIVVGCGVCRI